MTYNVFGGTLNPTLLLNLIRSTLSTLCILLKAERLHEGQVGLRDLVRVNAFRRPEEVRFYALLNTFVLLP